MSFPDETAVDYYMMGKQSESAGNFYKAVEMYKSALILNGKYFDAVVGLAHAYYGLDEFNEALKYVLDAETLDSQNTDLMNLKGRIYLNLGDLSEAKNIFSKILDKEENNIDAEFGLAELDIASGRVLTAENRYRDVLLVSPESRKALLALVLINDSLGDTDSAEKYLKQALQFYADNPFVRFTAAKHYYETNNLEEALYHLKTALFLQPEFLDATILLCKIYMSEKRYSEIPAVIEKSLLTNDDDYLLWYLLGRAYGAQGLSGKSVRSYGRALNIKPDDDISRLALENEIIDEFEMDSPLRDRFSEYHIDFGKKYEERNMLNKALKEYRRALVIDPYSIEARKHYAYIYKRKGYIERYLLILSNLVDEGYGGIDILDEIEIQKSMLETTVSEKWGIDQFTIDKEKNHFSIFFSDDGMYHTDGDMIISEYMEYLLNGYENIKIDTNDMSNQFSECYRKARNNNSDYFIIFRCFENERVVSLSADIYLASTGNKLKTINSVRTGNQMLPEVCRTTADTIHSLLPVFGRIINRKFDEILVNLGTKDGISVGDELLIVRKGELGKSKDTFDMEYEIDSVIGKYTVNNADELVSYGDIQIDMFFDMINPGDSVIYPPVKDEKETEDNNDAEDENLFYTGNLFNSITNIR